MFQKKTKIIFTAFVSLFLVFWVSALMAQASPQNNQQRGEHAAQQVQLDSDTINKFVSATQQINKIREEYGQKIQSTENQGKQQQLQQEAQGKMISALDKEDLNPQSYNQIIQAVQQDPELQQEIHARLQQSR